MSIQLRFIITALGLFASLLPPLNAQTTALPATPAGPGSTSGGPSLPALPVSHSSESDGSSSSNGSLSNPPAPDPIAEPAASAPAGQPATTLEECIAHALANNFDIQMQGLALANARESIAIARADFDPSLNVTTRHSANKSAVAGDALLEGAAAPTNENISTMAGVSRKFSAGTVVGLNSNLANLSRSNNPRSTFNPAYNSSLSLSVSQPLLRGFGAKYNRAGILSSLIGLDRSSLDYKGRVFDLIRDVENAYANLVSAREQLEVRRFSLELAQKLHEENIARRNTGLLTDLDVLTAEVGVANARNAVLLSQQTLRDREDTLRNLIGLSDLDTVIVPARLPDPPQTAPVIGRSYQLALKNQTDYQSALASLKQSELNVYTAKINRLPQLTLDGSLGYSGREADLREAWNKVEDRDSYNWALNLALRMPWGLHAENARYRTAINNLNSTKLRLLQLERDILVQIRSAVGAVRTNIESVRISALSAELSVRRYELEKARFDAGLSTARLVLEAQGDLESARLSLLQANVSLRTALAALHRLEGSSLERYKIDLPE